MTSRMSPAPFAILSQIIPQEHLVFEMHWNRHRGSFDPCDTVSLEDAQAVLEEYRSDILQLLLAFGSIPKYNSC